MEKRSIYEYVCDNLNVDGKVCDECKLENYLEDVYGKSFKYDKAKTYVDLKSDLLWCFSEQVENADKIPKIELDIFAIFEKMLIALDSSKLEEALKTKEININNDMYNFERIIRKNLDKMDMEKALGFCKENILKTQNMYAMYIYLLILSYTDVVSNEKIQDIVMRLALLDEFTLYINDYLIDKFKYPEYLRFYLVKRITDSNNISHLLRKISFNTDQVRSWVLFNFTSKDYCFGMREIIEKLDLRGILENWRIDEKIYISIGETILKLLSCKISKNIDYYTKIILKYFSMYSNFENSSDVFYICSEIYMEIHCSDKMFDEEVKKSLLSQIKKVMYTDSTIDTILNMLCDEDVDSYIKGKIYKAIVVMNITELMLKLYNTYKSNPLENAGMLFAFREKPDVLVDGIKLLDSHINWEEIIGEYHNIPQENTDYAVHVITSVCSDCQDLDLAMKILSKLLRASNVNYRTKAILQIELMLSYNKNNFLDDKNSHKVIIFSDELLESLDYLIKNELNYLNKMEAKAILHEYDGFDDIDLDLKFNMVGKEDEEILKGIENNNNKKRILNLKDELIHRLSMEETISGLDTLTSGKVLYVEEINDSFIACCQGEKFTVEYNVILKKDENYDLTEANCTCGNCKGDSYCRHVYATLLYLNKKNEKDHEATKKSN